MLFGIIRNSSHFSVLQNKTYRQRRMASFEPNDEDVESSNEDMVTWVKNAYRKTHLNPKP